MSTLEKPTQMIKGLQFTKVIAQVERDNHIDDISASRFTAILVDGSSDVSVVENEIPYVHTRRNGNSKVMFKHSAQLLRGQTMNIMSAVQQSIESRLKLKWEEFTQKSIAMGSDGASDMLGSKNGVVTLFQKYSPWLVAVHCYGHKIELAFKNVIRKVPLLERLQVLLYGLYYFYHRSPLNRSNLKAAVKDTGTGFSLVPTRDEGTQWVGYVLLALMNVTRGYSGIVLHLQQLVGNQIGSVSKDQQVKAKAYLKMLTCKDMVLVMHLMLDIQSVLKKASMSCQERNATAVDIHTQLQSVCRVLKKYEVSDGP